MAFFPGYFVYGLTSFMKNIFIDTFLFICFINELENFPFIIRTHMPIAQLSFYAACYL